MGVGVEVLGGSGADAAAGGFGVMTVATGRTRFWIPALEVAGEGSAFADDDEAKKDGDFAVVGVTGSGCAAANEEPIKVEAVTGEGSIAVGDMGVGSFALEARAEECNWMGESGSLSEGG